MSLFISALGPSLETFLKFKNSVGIQYNASAQWCLKSLDQYNFKHGNSTVLCKSLVVGWSIERSEHSNSKCGPWISPVREFGRYLRSMGDLDAYVLEYPVSQNSFRPEVYLLSDIEIQRFFKECDSYVLRKKTPGRPYVYPALYRFLYCCGARCGEARHQWDHLFCFVDFTETENHFERRSYPGRSGALRSCALRKTAGGPASHIAGFLYLSRDHAFPGGPCGHDRIITPRLSGASDRQVSQGWLL